MPPKANSTQNFSRPMGSLRAVVEEGNFAKAAERLNKNQSSVSYSLGLLNQQLPVAALQLSGRKAELTATGQGFTARPANYLMPLWLWKREPAVWLRVGAEVTLA